MGDITLEQVKVKLPLSNLSIYLWLHSPLVGPWPLFKFLNLI
jgi:hypothetical protein